MTLLNPSDWKATWIGENNLSNPGETKEGKTRLAARYLRKEFVADKPIQRAVLYISGLGFSGILYQWKTCKRRYFRAGPSWYPNRVYYNVYDVTDLLSKDKNTIGVALGNGRYFAMRDRQETLPSLLATTGNRVCRRLANRHSQRYLMESNLQKARSLPTTNLTAKNMTPAWN